MIKASNIIDFKIIKKNLPSTVYCCSIWTTAIVLLLCYWCNDITTVGFTLLLLIQLLASLSDICTRTIPIKLMITALGLGMLICAFFYKTDAALNCILGAGIAYFVMKLLILISKKQVGGGDLALMTVTGLFTGVNSLFSILFTSVVLTGIYSLALVLTKRVDKRAEIPFAPFILTATVILVLTNLKI